MTNPYLELFETAGNTPTTRRKIEIFKDTTRLGRERGVEVEIALEAANVSRRHAEIRREGDSYVLVDLGARKTSRRRWKTIKTVATGGRATKPSAPKLGPPPEIPPAEKVPDDLSSYVDFLHPGGSDLLDLGILVGMIFVFFVGTVVVLRSQDV